MPVAGADPAGPDGRRRCVGEGRCAAGVRGCGGGERGAGAGVLRRGGARAPARRAAGERSGGGAAGADVDPPTSVAAMVGRGRGGGACGVAAARADWRRAVGSARMLARCVRGRGARSWSMVPRAWLASRSRCCGAGRRSRAWSSPCGAWGSRRLASSRRSRARWSPIASGGRASMRMTWRSGVMTSCVRGSRGSAGRSLGAARGGVWGAGGARARAAHRPTAGTA